VPFNLPNPLNLILVRAIAMPCEVDEDKITATFQKGELKVVLPKSAQADVSGKRIVVNKG